MRINYLIEENLFQELKGASLTGTQKHFNISLLGSDRRKSQRFQTILLIYYVTCQLFHCDSYTEYINKVLTEFWEGNDYRFLRLCRNNLDRFTITMI